MPMSAMPLTVRLKTLVITKGAASGAYWIWLRVVDVAMVTAGTPVVEKVARLVGMAVGVQLPSKLKLLPAPFQVASCANAATGVRAVPRSAAAATVSRRQR